MPLCFAASNRCRPSLIPNWSSEIISRVRFNGVPDSALFIIRSFSGFSPIALLANLERDVISKAVPSFAALTGRPAQYTSTNIFPIALAAVNGAPLMCEFVLA